MYFLQVLWQSPSFPTNVFPGSSSTPSNKQICETVVHTQLFPLFFPSPSSRYCAELSHSCGCISKLPLKLSHTLFKVNRAGDILEDIFRKQDYGRLASDFIWKSDHQRDRPFLQWCHLSIKKQVNCHFGCHKRDTFLFHLWFTLRYMVFMQVNTKKKSSYDFKLIKSHDNVTE